MREWIAWDFRRAHGAYRTHETTLADALAGELLPGMLCLADRGFTNFKLWQKASATGAALVWRARSNADLPVEKVLGDGSYLSRIYPSEKAKRKKCDGIVVRVIEYRLEDVQEADPLYRLLTTILDPEQAPAQELAGLYCERWEVEGDCPRAKRPWTAAILCRFGLERRRRGGGLEVPVSNDAVPAPLTHESWEGIPAVRGPSAGWLMKS